MTSDNKVLWAIAESLQSIEKTLDEINTNIINLVSIPKKQVKQKKQKTLNPTKLFEQIRQATINYSDKIDIEERENEIRVFTLAWIEDIKPLTETLRSFNGTWKPGDKYWRIPK